MKRIHANNPLLAFLGIALLGFAGGCSLGCANALSDKMQSSIPTNARNIVVTSSKSADKLFEIAKDKIKNDTPCKIRTLREEGRRILTEECRLKRYKLRIDLSVEETSDGSRLSAIVQEQLGTRDSWQDVQYKRRGNRCAFEQVIVTLKDLPGDISFEKS